MIINFWILYIIFPITFIFPISTHSGTEKYFCFLIKGTNSPLKKHDTTDPRNITYFRIDEFLIRTKFSIIFNETIISDFKSISVNYTPQSSNILEKLKKKSEIEQSLVPDVITKYLNFILNNKHPKTFETDYEIFQSSYQHVYYPEYKNSTKLNKTSEERTSNTRKHRESNVNIAGHLINESNTYTYTLHLSLTKSADEFELSRISMTRFLNWDFSFGHYCVSEDHLLATRAKAASDLLAEYSNKKVLKPNLVYILPHSGKQEYHDMTTSFLFRFFDKENEDMRHFKEIFEFKRINNVIEEDEEVHINNDEKDKEQDDNDDMKEEEQENNKNEKEHDGKNGENTAKKSNTKNTNEKIKDRNKLWWGIGTTIGVLALFSLGWVSFYKMKNKNHFKIKGKFKRTSD